MRHMHGIRKRNIDPIQALYTWLNFSSSAIQPTTFDFPFIDRGKGIGVRSRARGWDRNFHAVDRNRGIEVDRKRARKVPPKGAPERCPLKVPRKVPVKACPLFFLGTPRAKPWGNNGHTLPGTCRNYFNGHTSENNGHTPKNNGHTLSK